MGERGPVPKRSSQRRRMNKDSRPEKVAAGAAAVPAPAVDESWHPVAADWFRSLGESGQAQFYEPSDWQTARVWADLLSRQLSTGRPSAQMISAWASGAAELLTTEGARRRARIELEREAVDEDEDAAVTAIDAYRARLSG